MRRAANVDVGQSAVVKYLRSLGMSVQPIHTLGKGVPDLLVGWRGQNFLLELKDGTKPSSAQKLTTAEDKWHKAWGGQVAITNSPEAAALAVIEAEGGVPES